MIKKFTLLFLLLIYIKPTTFSQFIQPPSQYLIKGKKTYTKHGSESRWMDITTSSVFASRFVESNSQYKRYLRYLVKENLDSLHAAALPNTKIWDKLDLTKIEKELLKENYWTSSEFEDYPILGLNKSQIEKYLSWKSLKLQHTWLKINNIEAQFSVERAYQHQQILIKYRLPLYTELISMFKEIENEFRGIPSNESAETQIKNTRYSIELLYHPKRPKRRDSEIKQKLKEIGIVSVYYTDLFIKEEKRKNIAYYELVIDYYKGDKLKPISVKSNFHYSDNPRTEWDVKNKYAEHPFLVFRCFSTVDDYELYRDKN